jgi:hypothetical protein
MAADISSDEALMGVARQIVAQTGKYRFAYTEDGAVKVVADVLALYRSLPAKAEKSTAEPAQIATIFDEWLRIFGEREIKYVSARDYARDSVLDLKELVLAALSGSTVESGDQATIRQLARDLDGACDVLRRIANHGEGVQGIEGARAAAKAFLGTTSLPVMADQIGAAEAEVGRWVYRRIEVLMDAKPGTAEAAELTYLAKVAEAVEEWGEDACGGDRLGDFPGQAEPAGPAEARGSQPAEPCFTCNGEGRIHDLDAHPGMFRPADMTRVCPTCEGSGKAEGQP